MMSQFWDDYLEGATADIRLPMFPRSSEFSAQSFSLDLDPQLTKKLHAAFPDSVEDALLASFAAILTIYTQQSSLIIGTPPHLISLKVDFSQTFQELVNHVQEQRQQVQGREPPTGIAPQVSFQEHGRDLSLLCTISTNQILLQLKCRAELYDSLFLKRMAKNIAFVLDSSLDHLDEPIEAHESVAPDEMEEIFKMGRGKRTSFEKNQSVQGLFAQNLAKYGNNPAIYYQGATLTYAELDAQANQLARHLKELGVQSREFVGVAVDRSSDHVVSLLGILKAGAIPVPIDASYPLERKLFMLEDTQVKILIVQKSYQELFPIEGLSTFIIDEQREALTSYSAEPLEIQAGSWDTININYTSGSTGKPKGVEATHRGVIRMVSKAEWVKFTPEDKILHMSNVSFDASSFEIWGALLNGACLYIYPHGEFSAESLAGFLKEHAITHAMVTARLFNLLVEFKLSSLSSLRFFASVGDVMSVAHANMAIEALPGCAVVNGYGPTENGVISTSFTAHNPLDLGQVAPIGEPIDNTDIFIVDPHFHPVPIGVAGEICCGGEGVAKGYLNRPDATRERFITNPFGTGTLYRTGDLGRFWQSGQIEFLGRIDTQVKIRGFRIELGEIEEAARAHPNVADCVVVAHQDKQGDKRLAAYAEPRGGTILTSDELRTHLEGKLTAVMMPSFLFVIPKLPVTPNGKVDRKALPSPEELIHQESTFEKPETPLEEIIANIWATLLELPRVGKKDNFLLIGGHSITAAEMAIRLGEVLKMQVSMGLIFEEPILENYAKRIKKSMEEVTSEGGRPITRSELFWVWRNRETRLDASISAENLPQPTESQYSQPRAIFLTGATGFVGAFMLRELLEETEATIYALVRADSADEGRQRLESTLKYYGLWREGVMNRIVPVAGDLEKPQLGIETEPYEHLTKEVDQIYHVGAYVNHAQPYSKLKAANVMGTVEALKIACKEKLKPFQFISTTAVFEPKEGVILNEDNDLNDSKLLINGYAESKWVAEKLVMQARNCSMPVNIFRLNRVSGDSKTGQGNDNDFLWRMAESSIHLKLAPDIGLQENVTPVDYVCRAIRAIASNPAHINQNYHISNPSLYSYKAIFSTLQKLGYPLSFIPYEEWRQTLIREAIEKKSKRLEAVAPLFSEIDLSHSDQATRYATENVSHALAGSGIACPKIDEKLIHLYVNALVAKGFFPQPLAHT